MAFESNEEILPGFESEKGDHLTMFLERVDGDPSALIVHLGDRLDAYNRDYFARQMGKLLSTGYRRFVLDCGGLNFVSATGMATVAELGIQAGSRGGQLAFARLQPKVHELFELLGLTGVFEFRPKIEEAVGTLAGPKLDGGAHSAA